MTEHRLKTWPGFFDAVEAGKKPFEVRRNDRGFLTGDILVLEKFDPDTQQYITPPQRLRKLVTFVLQGGHFGVEDGYCVLGLSDAP